MSGTCFLSNRLGLRLFSVSLIFVGVLLGITFPAAAVDVVFPDPNLEDEVRDALSIPEPTPITDTDMAILINFDGSSENISNIQGLEYASNMTHLDLSRNYQLSDISAVSGLAAKTPLRPSRKRAARKRMKECFMR